MTGRSRWQTGALGLWNVLDNKIGLVSNCSPSANWGAIVVCVWGEDDSSIVSQSAQKLTLGQA